MGNVYLSLIVWATVATPPGLIARHIDEAVPASAMVLAFWLEGGAEQEFLSQIKGRN